MSKAKEIKLFSNEISHPAEGDKLDVKVPLSMPPMPPDPNQPGTLCIPCTGIATRSNAYLYGIWIRCLKGVWQDTNPSNPNYFPNTDVTSSSQSVYIPVGAFVSPYAWTTPAASVPAWGADSTGNTKNTIKSVANYYTMAASAAQDSDLKHFDGNWVNVCSPAKAVDADVTLDAMAAPEPMYGPTQKDGDWLLYEGLPVSAIGAGNLLSRHGAPLRASVLAVAASRVYWTSILSNAAVIRRPCGDLVASGFASPFAGMPRNALIVHQPQHRHVLMSECRDKPDLIHVDRNTDIRLHVNFESPVFPTAGLLVGSYDLWVKVID